MRRSQRFHSSSSDAPQQTGKFQKGDTVHKAIMERGLRTKGIFTVADSRADASGSYIKYRLKKADGTLYNNGEWFRERDLKLESQRG